TFNANDYKLRAVLAPLATVTRVNIVKLNVLNNAQSVYARVAAHNVAGYGVKAVSTPTSVQATNHVPGVVSALRVDVVSDTQLLVQWQDPLENGGQNVTEFNVEWYTGAAKWNQIVKNADFSDGVNDIEVISVSAPSVGGFPYLDGTFQLMFDNQVTDELPFDISAVKLQQVLQALCTIDAVLVTRELGPNGYTWLVTFAQVMYAGNQFTQYASLLQNQIGHRLSVLGNNLLVCSDIARTNCERYTVNGGETISPTAVTGSVPEVQTLLCTAGAGHMFQLNYMGYVTTPISSTATLAQVTAALASLPYVKTTVGFSIGQVSVCDAATPLPVTVQFNSEMGDVPLLTASGADVGVTVTIAIAETTKGRFHHRIGKAPRSYLISGLTPSVAYNVRVAAYNNVGYGTFQPALSTYIPVPKGPMAPASVQVVPQTATSFGVVWEEPVSYGGSNVASYVVEWDNTRTFRSRCGDNAEVQYLSVQGVPPLVGTQQFQLAIGTTTVGCVNWGITAANLQTLIRGVAGYGAVTVVQHGDDSAAWDYGHMYEVTFYAPLTAAPLGDVPTMVASLVAGCNSFATGTLTVTTKTFGPGLDEIQGVGRQTSTDNECNALYLRPVGRKTTSDSSAKSAALALNVLPGTNSLKPFCASCAQTLTGTTVAVTMDMSASLFVGDVFSIGQTKCVYTIQAITASSITVAPGQLCPSFSGQALPVYRYAMRAYVVQDVEAGTPFYVRVAAQNALATGPPNYSY
ncbi:hypothetical protein DYB26_009680, partial [Aphanomyces astaci]